MLDFRKFKVLTFDCYGTLIDWESGIVRAVRNVLKNHQLEFDDRSILEAYARAEAKIESGAYEPYKKVLRRVMTEMSAELLIEPSDDERDALALSVRDWKPFPDTVRALKRLGERYQLAIISNIDDDLFQYSAEHLEVPFDWVITAQQAESYKPSHNNFQMAFGRMGFPKEKILHVAQSIYHDIVPARQLGLSTVWVNRRAKQEGWGATPPADGKPDLEVPDLESLADMVEGAA
ncbi:MAG: haloacid dehalogenase type II [bacterium]|nr:haloacid dehalogenase type II [bacterium]